MLTKKTKAIHSKINTFEPNIRNLRLKHSQGFISNSFLIIFWTSLQNPSYFNKYFYSPSSRSSTQK